MFGDSEFAVFREKDQLLNMALVGKISILDRCPEEDSVPVNTIKKDWTC